ncbi:MBOAT, membrane-bound O-acyltransferase family-domain-containing protein [Crepidotus variabilis]|uniref:MBOAT, membrane-bound O-acyltransferase family-domain-containing protein n=1 Tax=Crepidotus variabilis TaxID=179855 RepID=A0A9P6ELB4_9AGAR|nr:MBOAT, membrane-bound O-acyltransferase family-domain-containing protein [Crepidotus variabilis]
MDALFLPLADAVGASVDQIKLIFCLLVAYPLGSLFVRVPASSPNLRHLFSIGVALLFFFPVLKIYSAFFQLLGSILATFFIAKHDRSSKMPWLVFVIVMGHLTVNHIIRALNGSSYETMEVTGPQMVLTMKLTTFAWNVYDGRRKAEDLDKWQLSKRVTEYPSLLAFLGYSFYFPGILVGPYLDFQEYTDLVNETMFQHSHVKATVKAGRRLPPGRKRAAYTKMVMGLVYLGSFVVLGPTINFTVALKPEFAKYSLIERIVRFQLGGPIERAKYYAIWTLTEGASILTGLGFTDIVNGQPQWDGAANVKVMQIEFPSNFKVLLDAWNMKTNIWLRECVYKRVTPKGQKPGNMSSMITFFTSAFWHGIAGGYYLTFLMGGFITASARLARQNIRPLLLPTPTNPSGSSLKPVYDVLGTVTSIAILNYSAAPFIILSASDSIRTWNVLGWYGHIVIIGSLLFFYFGGTRYFRGLQKRNGILPASKGKPGTTNGVSTPATEKNFVLPPSVDKVLPQQ